MMRRSNDDLYRLLNKAETARDDAERKVAELELKLKSYKEALVFVATILESDEPCVATCAKVARKAIK